THQSPGLARPARLLPRRRLIDRSLAALRLRLTLSSQLGLPLLGELVGDIHQGSNEAHGLDTVLQLRRILADFVFEASIPPSEITRAGKKDRARLSDPIRLAPTEAKKPNA